MKPMSVKLGIHAIAALALLCIFRALPVGAAEQNLSTLKNLNLDQLADLQVSILSRRPERLADSAAAVYVLTAEDIRRSGYTSIPELLRLVPGLTVARLDTPEWAITSRGFNGQFANKLLVMVDGRSVYTPLFSGVFWEAIDSMLEDIERIEVIRGPGASTWGANAVNGVINIITRHAADTEGGLLSTYAGNQQRGLAGRYGSAIGEHGYVRLYAKQDDRDGQLTTRGELDGDELASSRVGIRSDWDLSADDSLMVQGELFDTDAHDPLLRGGNLMLQWEHARESGALDTLQVYYDHFELDTGSGNEVLREDLDTLDLEFRHHFAPLGRHDLIAGLGYRWHNSDIQPGLLNGAQPPERSFQRFSAFIQDEIRLIADRWFLTLGSKLEHNDFSGVELQPTLRTRWHPRPDSTLWASVSRAVRTPSRSEHDLVAESQLSSVNPVAGFLPVTARTQGNKSMDSESVIAYELGYRWRPDSLLGLDLALFYNDYDRLRTVELGAPQLALSPYPRLVVPASVDNLMRGQTYGLEFTADWRPAPAWRLQAWYSLMKMDLQQDAASTDPMALDQAGQFPQQQVGLRTAIDLRHDLELDLFARYADRLPAFDVDAYLELDVRLGWQMQRNLSLALVGRNLLNPSHQEYGQDILGGAGRKIEREWFLRAELRF